MRYKNEEAKQKWKVKENEIRGQLRAARIRHHITQDQVCRAGDFSSSYIRMIENDDIAIGLRIIFAYCDAVGITPNDVLGYQNPRILPELSEQLYALNTTRQRQLTEKLRSGELSLYLDGASSHPVISPDLIKSIEVLTPEQQECLTNILPDIFNDAGK